MGSLVDAFDSAVDPSSSKTTVTPSSASVDGGLVGAFDAGASLSANQVDRSSAKYSDVRNAVESAVAKKLLLNIPAVGVGEGAANMITGMVAKPVSDIAGLSAAAYSALTGDKDGDPQGFKNYVQDKLTYDPRGSLGKAVAEYNPISMIGKGWGLIGQAAGDAIKGDNPGIVRQGIGNAVAEAVPQAVNILGAKAGAVKPTVPVIETLPQSAAMKAATSSAMDVPTYLRNQFAKKQAERQAEQNTAMSPKEPVPDQAKPAPPPTIADAPPEFQAAAKGKLNDAAMQRHVESQSLPVPIELTEGQATGDVNKISNEQNMRGKYPDMAERFAAQNPQIIKNLDAFKEASAPNTNASGVALDQSLVDAYKKMDAPIKADVSAKYKALEDANGGNFPLDGKTFVENTEAALDKALKSGSVPEDIQSSLNAFKNGRQMTFQDFESLRSDLADAMRNSSNGRQRAAANIIREQLENMPLSPEAAGLKPLADAARSAAKARFDKISADPAYKAAVDDDAQIGEPSPIADKFINKYVINGKTANVQNMLKNLSADSSAKEAIAAGTINHLKLESGIDTRTNTGNVSQSGLNKAIRALDQKKGLIFDPKTAQQLDTLGNVARYTQEQPRGSYVNNANTFVGAIANHAKGLANFAMDVKTLGATKFGREILAKNKEKKAVETALKPAAGTKLSKFP